MRRNKDPINAAILNFFIWGGGYLYIGNRKIFVYGLILVTILEHIPLLVLGLSFITTYPYYLYLIGHILLSIMFACDAYIMAMKLGPN